MSCPGPHSWAPAWSPDPGVPLLGTVLPEDWVELVGWRSVLLFPVFRGRGAGAVGALWLGYESQLRTVSPFPDTSLTRDVRTLCSDTARDVFWFTVGPQHVVVMGDLAGDDSSASVRGLGPTRDH